MQGVMALDDSKRRLAKIPPLMQFCERVSTLLSGGPERFEECRSDFETLLRERFMERFIQEELSTMVAEAEYHPKDATDSRIMIVRSEMFTLWGLLVRGSSDPRTLSGTAENLFVGVLGPGVLKVQHYVQPAPYPHDVLDRSKILQMRGTDFLEPGTVLRFRALEDVPVFEPAASDPVLLLMFASRPVSGVRWNYDRATLLPKQMVSTDGSVSRLEHTIALLAHMRDRSSVQPLLAMLEHPQHFVRWAALRALGRIDPAVGLEQLRAAVHDPHPHIRNAAVRSLARIDGEASRQVQSQSEP